MLVLNPVGNLINERPTVSGCESSRNKGHSKKLDGQGPCRFSTLCLVSSPALRNSFLSGFAPERAENESKLSLMTEADLIGDLLGRITGDHQQNKGESNPA